MANASNWSPLVNSPVWRFTLRQLFIWTAFVAVACVALRNASASWAASIFGLTFLILTASLLLATFRDGRQRSYWIGFATAGWLYLILLGYSSSIDNANGQWANPFKQDALITTQLTQTLYVWMCAKIDPPPPPGTGASGFGGMPGMGSGMMMPGGLPGGMYGSDGGMGGSSDGMSGHASAGPEGAMPGMMGMGMGGGAMPPPAPTPFIPAQHDFTNVAQALWTLLLAACGGGLATWLYATRSRQGGGEQTSNP